MLIGSFLDQGFGILDAIKETCMNLIGSYNIVLIYIKDPNSIYMVKNSGDLAIAHDVF